MKLPVRTSAAAAVVSAIDGVTVPATVTWNDPLSTSASAVPVVGGTMSEADVVPDTMPLDQVAADVGVEVSIPLNCHTMFDTEAVPPPFILICPLPDVADMSVM